MKFQTPEEAAALSKARTEARARAQTILDAADAAARDVTPEERLAVDDAIAEVERIDGIMSAEIRNRVHSAQDARSGRAGGSSGDEIRDMVESGERSHDFDVVKAFNEQRTIADFSDSASLYTSDFSNRFAMYMRTMSPWFAVATVINAADGRPLVVPGLSADPTSYTPGEGTAITAADPTLGNVTVSPTSFKALTYITAEALEDAEYDLTGFVAQSQARSISLAFGSAATTDVLSGISNGGTASGLGGGSTATFIGLEDWLDLAYGRAAPYRQVGAYVASNGAILKARKYTTTTGEYLWDSSRVQGQPDTFDGHPVYEDPYLAAVGSASKSVIFGDLASALIIKASSLRTAVSRDFKFDLDVVAVKSVLRADIAVMDSAAAAYLVSADA